MMEKRNYCSPRLAVEHFIPNEYVAACWYVACEIPTTRYENSKAYYGQDTSGAWHSKRDDYTGCGWAQNQHVFDRTDGRFSIVEENTKYTSDLNAKITSELKSVTDGAYLEWTTNDGSTMYYHHGYIHFSDNTRPLHS